MYYRLAERQIHSTRWTLARHIWIHLVYFSVIFHQSSPVSYDASEENSIATLLQTNSSSAVLHAALACSLSLSTLADKADKG